jgi:hypothetical protein
MSFFQNDKRNIFLSKILTDGGVSFKNKCCDEGKKKAVLMAPPKG